MHGTKGNSSVVGLKSSLEEIPFCVQVSGAASRLDVRRGEVTAHGLHHQQWHVYQEVLDLLIGRTG